MSIFSKIKAVRPRRTMHNLSYASKLTLPFGRLVPIMCEKVVPGDKFFHGHEFLMRFAPFHGQVFQQYDVRTEYYFVPSRLLWNNFEMFLSDGIDGTDTSFVHPYVDYKYFLGENFGASFNAQMPLINTLFDYFNLPTEYNFNGTTQWLDASNISSDVHIDALPFLAYLKIFMDYYADENLDYATYVQLFINFSQQFSDGDQTAAIFSLFGNVNFNGTLPASPTIDDHHDFVSPFRRAYRKDYFTSALPWAQRGPVVAIPLNGSGDVQVYGQGTGFRYQGVGIAPSSTTGTDIEVKLYQYGAPFGQKTSNSEVGSDMTFSSMAAYGDSSTSFSSTNAVIGPVASANEIKFKAVNINGTATITDLRTAIAVQNWLEKRARSGVRPKEQIMSSFGVRTKDYRLDRAELLQATKDVISIGEVFTTAQNDSETFVPGLGVSTATGAGRSRQWKHFFEEHGYVIGLMSIMPRASYYQGIPRQFSELDKYDYYWPEFQHIGEQAILNKEICLREGLDNDDVFGYTPRGAHYKSRTDQVHGNFRTNLNFMHAGRVWNFGFEPHLNNEFVYYNEEDNDQLRPFNAVTPYSNAVPVFCDFYHNFKALRPMDYFGSPRFI